MQVLRPTSRNLENEFYSYMSAMFSSRHRIDHLRFFDSGTILSSNMKTMKLLGIHQTADPIFAVFVDQARNSVVFLLERESSRLMVFLQNSALVLCFQFVLHFSQQVSLLFCTGVSTCSTLTQRMKNFLRRCL